jgi:two-component system, chemotaxis family, chemotaxis protein CheY
VSSFSLISSRDGEGVGNGVEYCTDWGMPMQQYRRARVRPGHYRSYPATYHGQWFPVVERHDPDVPDMPGFIWLNMAGGPVRVESAHFELLDRAKPLVLVVDDDFSIRQTLQIALSNAGYDVLQGRDGEEATRLWHESGPDLIITDIHMPRKSGLLFLQDLQEHDSTTPVIAMTDGGPAKNLTLLGVASLLGSLTTVVKPFTLEEMVKTVDQAVGR